MRWRLDAKTAASSATSVGQETIVQVFDWPDGGTESQEEPACGEHYSPYGPLELSYVTAMVADVALECLLTPPRRSFSRVFVASRDRIEESGGCWSEEWIAEQGSECGGPGVRTVDRLWTRRSCPACEAQAGETAGDDFNTRTEPDRGGV